MKLINPKFSKLKKHRTQSGVVLIEALVAVLIFSLGILALVGLQGAMIKNTGELKYRADASFIAQKRLGRMWADPENLANYADVKDISDQLPNGSRTTTVGPKGLVTVTVTWQAPGSSIHSYIATSHVGI